MSTDYPDPDLNPNTSLPPFPIPTTSEAGPRPVKLDLSRTLDHMQAYTLCHDRNPDRKPDFYNNLDTHLNLTPTQIFTGTLPSPYH